MTISTIQINTVKDRFNFVLHAAANLGLLAGMVCADKSALNFGMAVAGVGLPYIIRPVLARREALLNFFNGKPGKKIKLPLKNRLDDSVIPMSSAAAIMSGDVARLQRVSNSISRKLGIDPVEVRVIGSLSEDSPKQVRYKRKLKNFADAREAAKEDIEARMLASFNGKRAVLGMNRVTGKKVIGISRKLLRDLTNDEQAAVIGHELGHSAAQHAKLESIANFAGNIAMNLAFLHAGNIVTSMGTAAFPDAGRALYNVWLARKLLHSNFSRVHEFQADKLGALATSPQALISDLYKIADIAEGQELKERFWEKIPYLMHSHPSVPKRIRRLQKISPKN